MAKATCPYGFADPPGLSFTASDKETAMDKLVEHLLEVHRPYTELDAFGHKFEKCPVCGGEVNKPVKKCPHCGADLIEQYARKVAAMYTKE